MSVSRLWSDKYNPTRGLWEIYPISHQLHGALYGQKDFDAMVFLHRYRRHNWHVLEYFKDRPGDLLVMDMDGGGEWAELCAFLGRPIPSCPYPRSNPSSQIIAAVTT